MSTKVLWGMCIDTEEEQTLLVRPRGVNDAGQPMVGIKSDAEHELKIPVEVLEEALKQIRIKIEQETDDELGRRSSSTEE